MPRCCTSLILALIVAFALTPSVDAGTVKSSLTERVSWVGSPIILRIVFEDIESYETPTIPEAEGLTITATGPPSTYSQQTIINGKLSSSTTLTYQYAIDATSPGTWEVPEISIEADGQQYFVEPTPVIFHSSEDVDLMEAKILNVPDRIWLGQSMRAVLQIAIKPYASPQLRGDRMSTTDMWRQIDPQQSNWGLFFDAAEELYEQGRTPPARVVEHTGQAGEKERWYAFEITADVLPDRAGPIQLSDVRIHINYPTQLGRGRTSIFNPIASLSVTASRPVTASPTSDTVEVMPPPLADRPSTWSGAVGRFDFDVSASPTEVVVGEPITLTMTITDRSSPPADLDVLQPPRLDQDEALVSMFRVPEEQPGGRVEGRSKIFTQTIRAEHGDIASIPPISMAYFDPKKTAYEVAFSRPIPITVESSRTVSTGDLGLSPLTTGDTDKNLTSVQGGLLANYSDPSMLLARPTQPVLWWLWVALLGPPLLYLATEAAAQSANRATQPARSRARRASTVLTQRLAAAGSSPEGVAAALRSFVADRLSLPEAGLTRQEAVDCLRQAGHANDAEALDQQLATLEQRAYAGASAALNAADHEAISSLARQLGRSVKGHSG